MWWNVNFLNVKFLWKFSVVDSNLCPESFLQRRRERGRGVTHESNLIVWTYRVNIYWLMSGHYWHIGCPDGFEKDQVGQYWTSASMHHPRDFGASPEQNEVAIEYNCLAALLLQMQFSNPILDSTIKLKEFLRKWFIFSVFSLLPFRERYQTTLSPSEI